VSSICNVLGEEHEKESGRLGDCLHRFGCKRSCGLLFELAIFNPAQQKFSIDQILLNPNAWVNKRVEVEGNFTGPVVSTPGEVLLPWNYELVSSGANGVAWNSSANYESGVVMVTGIVRERRIGSLQLATVIYYIEAETVVPVPLNTMCRFCHDSWP
jgi:hypothetical protein